MESASSYLSTAAKMFLESPHTFTDLLPWMLQLHTSIGEWSSVSSPFFGSDCSQKLQEMRLLDYPTLSVCLSDCPNLQFKNCWTYFMKFDTGDFY
jgi:hypothetical protein